MTFQPTALEVTVGDTVAWINRDLVPHTATGVGKPAWTTGQLSQGQGGELIPRQAGEFRYFCELHPMMKGTVIVR